MDYLVLARNPARWVSRFERGVGANEKRQLFGPLLTGDRIRKRALARGVKRMLVILIHQVNALPLAWLQRKAAGGLGSRSHKSNLLLDQTGNPDQDDRAQDCDKDAPNETARAQTN